MDNTTKKRFDMISQALDGAPSLNRALLKDFSEFQKGQATIGKMLAEDSRFQRALALGSVFDGFDKIGLQQFSIAAASAHEATLSLRKLIDIPGLRAITEHMNQIAPPWQKISASIAPMGSLLATMNEAQHLGLQAHFSKISSISILAEKTLLDLDTAKFGTELGIGAAFQKVFEAEFAGLGSSYAQLMRSFEPFEHNVFHFHPAISSRPPIEYYNHTTLARVFSPTGVASSEEQLTIDADITDENDDALIELLRTLDPGLIELLEGGRAAMRSSEPDHVRHSVTSYRELHTHVLHRLAPDKAVLEWTKNPELFDEKGRPTRATRLRYICRKIAHGPFSDFVDKDITSMISLVNLFQQGTHEVKSPLTDEQLIALKVRTECSLRFLLEVGLRITAG